MRVAFAGSFDPFTAEHGYLVEEALRVFGEVDVLVADNEEKMYLFKAAERLDLAVLSVPDTRIPRGSLRFWRLPPGEMAARFAKQLGCTAMLRGIRNGQDLEYEAQIEAYNREHFGVPTVVLLARKPNVSSSVTRATLIAGKTFCDFFGTMAAQDLAVKILRDRKKVTK